MRYKRDLGKRAGNNAGVKAWRWGVGSGSVGLSSPMFFLCPGPLLPLYPTPTMGSPFPLMSLPPPLYPMVCSMEHPLSADIAMATRADEDGDT